MKVVLVSSDASLALVLCQSHEGQQGLKKSPSARLASEACAAPPIQRSTAQGARIGANDTAINEKDQHRLV